MDDAEIGAVERKITKIKNNPDNFQCDYVIGYNNNCHDNLVWNFMYGWFAYTCENLIIVEEL